MLQILFAFLAGILTITAPCILPMLPILLGASVGHTSRQRPLLIVLGFIVSFGAFSLLLSALVNHLGLSPNTLRYIAVSFIALFAVFMLWPKPFELLTQYMSPAINSASRLGDDNGNMGGLLLGLVLGIIWTPCAGPILGTILTLIATQGATNKSVLLLTVYAVGAGLPMLLIIYGGQYITTKVRAIAQYSVRIQQIFGVLVLLLAGAMFFQYDVLAVNKLTSFFPQNKLEQKLVDMNANTNPANNNSTTKQFNNSIKVKFADYGKAPEFTGITKWLNSDALTMESLKGKVVLVDFWTYSCINCIRTLPYVTKWYDTYKDQGLVVVGVHTPEFEFEKVTSNVETAIERYKIHYPVAQDNSFATWLAYKNQYWPAKYLVDQNGNIVYEHFGEGDYDVTETAIRQLLGLDQTAKSNSDSNSERLVRSPEMYFGTNRLENLSSAQRQNSSTGSFEYPDKLNLNEFALKGKWQFSKEYIKCVAAPCSIKLRYAAGKVFMVASSEKTSQFSVMVNGEHESSGDILNAQLYQIVDTPDYNEKEMEIIFYDPGVEVFTFTFG